MSISNERYQSLLASGSATLVREESITRPALLTAHRLDLEAGENGIRVKKIGCLELSDNILILIIKNDQIIGTAVLSEDQLEFLTSSWCRDFDHYQTIKDQ